MDAVDLSGMKLDAVYGASRGTSDTRFEIKYGLPDAPRKHLLVLEGGSLEICDSQEAAASRIGELGLGRLREVWEMKKRTIVRRARRPLT